MNLAVSGGLGARAIPWFKQIHKVFVCGLAQHNGHSLKVLWAKYANQCQAIARTIFKILEWRIFDSVRSD